jgi:TrpR-related protein YerC/YecD
MLSEMARQTSTDTTPPASRPTAVDPGSRAVETVPGLSALAEAFQTLETREEVERFLRDLCTLPELEALTHRWQTVLLLDQGVPYVEIAERVPTSTATVTRVAQWLRHGTGGYALALERAREGHGR